MKITRALATSALLLLCAAITTPGSFADGKNGGVSEWNGKSTLTEEPNCFWRCSDGRTGSAEVTTAEQCTAACSGACGGPCVLVDN